MRTDQREAEREQPEGGTAAAVRRIRLGEEDAAQQQHHDAADLERPTNDNDTHRLRTSHGWVLPTCGTFTVIMRNSGELERTAVRRWKIQMNAIASTHIVTPRPPILQWEKQQQSSGATRRAQTGVVGLR
jgi:hypothetical protein